MHHDALCSGFALQGVQAWFGVEEDADVVGAVVQDLKDDLQDGFHSEPNIGSDDDEADPSAAVNYLCTQPEHSYRPPPYTDVARQFGNLEEAAGRCNMPEVSYHLRKARLAWMRDYASRTKTK